MVTKNKITTPLLIIGLIFSGCSAAVHKVNYGQQYQAKAVNCALDTYYPRQQIPKKVITIGEASALEGGLTVSCGRSLR